MECGVSTACFYPEETIEGLAHLGQLNVPCAEVFLNTARELTPAYANALSLILRKHQICIAALHPFTSGMETFFFATDYPTRIEDGYFLYRQYFAFCQMLNIPRFVFHGMSKGFLFPLERYAEHYLRLREMARGFGVDFLHENVVRCICSQPETILQLRELTREDIGFVFDIKQARRAQVNPLTMLEAMGAHVQHLHLSDFTSTCDCAVPGFGAEDFEAVAKKLRAIHFDGTAILEVYRSGFGEAQELAEGLSFLNRIFIDNKGDEQP